MADTPLQHWTGWTDRHIERLGRSWITTAEQVVAIAATPGGLQSLAEQLEVSEDEAQRLVAVARAQLPTATRAEMEEVADTSKYGLGVVRPQDEAPRS
jgi:hypothetical protein